MAVDGQILWRYIFLRNTPETRVDEATGDPLWTFTLKEKLAPYGYTPLGNSVRFTANADTGADVRGVIAASLIMMLAGASALAFRARKHIN